MTYEEAISILRRFSSTVMWLDEPGCAYGPLSLDHYGLLRPTGRPSAPVVFLTQEELASVNWVVRDTDLTSDFRDYRGYLTFFDHIPIEETEEPCRTDLGLNTYIAYSSGGVEILRLTGEGEIFWKGKKVEAEWELVAGLRELLHNLKTQPPALGSSERPTAWEHLVKDG